MADTVLTGTQADVVTVVSQTEIKTEVLSQAVTTTEIWGGVREHRLLLGRTVADSHPVSAITGLQGAMDGKVDKVTGKQLSAEDYTTGEKSKLSGIAAGAEVNVNADWNATTGDAAILNKPDLPNLYEPKNANIQSHVSSTANPHGVTAAQAGAVPATSVGAANGVAPLGSDSKIASAYLPSYVDDVVEVANLAALPVTGEAGKIYVALDTGKIYRWSGSAYAEISPSPGSTDSVTEGATNLYFTAARVRDVILTGLSVATNTAIAATDTILAALGKLQAQITAKASKGANSDITSLSGLTTALSVAQGGTGATDAATARANLGAAAVNAAATITYGANGVSTIATDGTTYTITYNANGTVNTISDGTTTRTCTYTSGNLTSVA